MAGESEAVVSLAAEALRIVRSPDARLELTLRTRRARPASVRDLALYAMVRELDRRRRWWLRVFPGCACRWHELAPEYPVTPETVGPLWSRIGGE